MPPLRQLHVIWRAPTPQGARHLVGTLQRDASGYTFAYDSVGVVGAQQVGFTDVPGLPITEATHQSGYLFPIFWSVYHHRRVVTLDA